jgi:hypothetical protein
MLRSCNATDVESRCVLRVTTASRDFPTAQDCIVMGVDLLRQQNQSNYVPYVKKRTSPLVATLLSFICPGLGAAYNGQTVKALVHFAVFVGFSRWQY